MRTRREWVGVDLNSALHGGLPDVSVLSGQPAGAEVSHRFGMVVSQRVPPGGPVGAFLMEGLGRMRLIPYARRTEIARIPVTVAEARTERLRTIATLVFSFASVLVWVIRPELPAVSGELIPGYDSVMFLFVVLFGIAVAIRPRVRVRVSTKDSHKGRARVLAHPGFIEALPLKMRRGIGRRRRRRLPFGP